jgi:hypothetical protein
LPGEHIREFVQATPVGVPPLELLPVTGPPVLDPAIVPLLDPPLLPAPPLLLDPPPLLDVGVPPAASSAALDSPASPVTGSSLPPHADARATTSNTATRRGSIRFSRSTAIEKR